MAFTRVIQLICNRSKITEPNSSLQSFSLFCTNCGEKVKRMNVDGSLEMSVSEGKMVDFTKRPLNLSKVGFLLLFLFLG